MPEPDPPILDYARPTQRNLPKPARLQRRLHPADFLLRLVLLVLMTAGLYGVITRGVMRFSNRRSVSTELMPIVLGVCAIIATLILNAVWSRLPYSWVSRLRQVVVSAVVGSMLTGFLLVAGTLVGWQLGLSGVMKDLFFYIAILAGIALGIGIIWRSPE